MTDEQAEPQRTTASADDARPCAWCAGHVGDGAEVVVCVCGGRHHATCWDQHGGCATGDCGYAPSAQWGPPGSFEEPAAGEAPPEDAPEATEDVEAAPVVAAEVVELPDVSADEEPRRYVAPGELAEPCPWCEDAIAAGEEVMACNVCGSHHHADCWDDRGGCATPDCEYAPLARLDEPPPRRGPAPVPSLSETLSSTSKGAPARSKPAAAQQQAPKVLEEPPPGYKRCPSCDNVVQDTADICDFCDHVLTEDGVFRGDKINAPGAVSSLVWAIAGLIVCGVILGAVAISESQKAKDHIATNPRYKGGDYAQAGFVIGIIAIVGGIIRAIYYINNL